MAVSSVIGNSNAFNNQYATQGAAEANNSEMSMDDFWQLMAAQLQYQDMTNPMSNSEMMAQMTQMAMVQSIGTMTDAVNNSMNITTQTYAAGLVGQEITVAVTEENEYGQPVAVGVKYGIVESVSLVGGNPTIRLADDGTDYSLSYIVGMGKIDNPFGGTDKGEEEEGSVSCVEEKGNMEIKQ